MVQSERLPDTAEDSSTSEAGLLEQPDIVRAYSAQGEDPFPVNRPAVPVSLISPGQFSVRRHSCHRSGRPGRTGSNSPPYFFQRKPGNVATLGNTVEYRAQKHVVTDRTVLRQFRDTMARAADHTAEPVRNRRIPAVQMHASHTEPGSQFMMVMQGDTTVQRCRNMLQQTGDTVRPGSRLSHMHSPCPCFQQSRNSLRLSGQKIRSGYHYNSHRLPLSACKYPQFSAIPSTVRLHSHILSFQEFCYFCVNATALDI